MSSEVNFRFMAESMYELLAPSDNIHCLITFTSPGTEAFKDGKMFK